MVVLPNPTVGLGRSHQNSRQGQSDKAAGVLWWTTGQRLDEECGRTLTKKTRAKIRTRQYEISEHAYVGVCLLGYANLPSNARTATRMSITHAVNILCDVLTRRLANNGIQLDLQKPRNYTRGRISVHWSKRSR